MNYEDIKRHFESHPPPEQVQWTDWAYISDTQLFLKSCYIGIRNFNGSPDRCPAWWHLRDFYILMKKTQQSSAPAEIQNEEPASEQNASEENAAGKTASEPSEQQPQAEI